MKKFKTFIIVLSTFFATIVYAQDKVELKAVEQTKEFNLKLGEYKLSADQEKQITAIYIEKLTEMKELNKKEASEEEKKAVHKKYAKQISDLLSSEQKVALKEYNEKNKKN